LPAVAKLFFLSEGLHSGRQRYQFGLPAVAKLFFLSEGWNLFSRILSKYIEEESEMIEMKLFESGLKKTGELLRVVAILLMLPVCLFSATDLQVDVSAMPSLVLQM
jgi:hypothetical protein